MTKEQRLDAIRDKAIYELDRSKLAFFLIGCFGVMRRTTETSQIELMEEDLEKKIEEGK